MSKNPQKKCHRNSNVSMTRLSNNSNNKKQMYHYSHESGRAVEKWFLSSEHCPQVPLGTYHLSTSNRENGSDGRTYPFLSCCHYHCTALPTQSLAFFPIPIPLCFTGVFSFFDRKVTICLLFFFFLFIIQNDLYKTHRKQVYVLLMYLTPQ